MLALLLFRKFLGLLPRTTAVVYHTDVLMGGLAGWLAEKQQWPGRCLHVRIRAGGCKVLLALRLRVKTRQKEKLF